MEEEILSTDMIIPVEKKKISENFKLMDLKRDHLRQSILTLSVNWKDLEDNLVSAENAFEEGANELQQRETNFSVYEQEQMEYFRTREKFVEDMFDKFGSSVQEKMKEIDLKEEELQSKLNEFQSAHEEFIGRMEADYKSRYKELESLQDLVEKRLNKLNAEEKQFQGRLNELLQKEKDVEVIEKIFAEDFIVKDKELQERSIELHLIQKQNEATRNEIELKIKEFDTKKNRFDSFEAFFDKKMKELDLKEELAEETSNLLEQKGKEIEVERRRIEKRKRNFKIKEKLLTKTVISHVKIEKMDEMSLINGSPACVSFTITMDGKNLQLFLNENSNDSDSICEEVLKILKLSTDPSMLVLDAMEGFYPPHLMAKGDKMFETSVVMNTCIILLQQLGKISPMIQSNAKKMALKLAEEWKNKISLTDCNSLEVFGLLHLLASYDLAADFGPNDIIKFLNLVAEDDKVFELCCLPGFADKIPDLIKQFIEQSRFILAVRFICKLDLADKFPPVPLLKNHIKIAKDVGKEQKKTIDEKITSLKAVMSCIMELNLQSQYPPEKLQICIEELLKEKVDGTNELLVFQSQNREECRKLNQSSSRKKHCGSGISHPSHGSNSKHRSEFNHNPNIIHSREPIRGYFPIASSSQSSLSYYRHRTGHITSNPHLWTYGQGMASPHLPPLGVMNRDRDVPMRYGWSNENHFYTNNYDGRRY